MPPNSPTTIPSGPTANGGAALKVVGVPENETVVEGVVVEGNVAEDIVIVLGVVVPEERVPFDEVEEFEVPVDDETGRDVLFPRELLDGVVVDTEPVTEETVLGRETGPGGENSVPLVEGL